MKITSSTQTAAIGHPAYTQTFPCEPETAGRARHLVASALNTWGLEQLEETGKSIVSELVANTVEHTKCHIIRITVSRPAPNWVRVAVVDKSRTLPVLREVSETGENGRGLFVVEALSDRWGTDLTHWGKRVWAEVRTGDAL